MHTMARICAAALAVAASFPAHSETDSEARVWIQKMFRTTTSSPIESKMSGWTDMGALMTRAAEASGEQLPAEAQMAAKAIMRAKAVMITNGVRLQRIQTTITVAGLPFTPDADSGDSMEMSIVHVRDGETLWLQTNNPMLGVPVVMKMGLDAMEALTDDERQSLGLGSSSFADPTAHLRLMTEMVDYELLSVENGEVTLSGRVNQQLVEKLTALNPADAGNTELANVLINELGSLTLVLDERTAFPKRLVMGDPEPFSAMEFTEHRILEEDEIPEGTFDYSPPEGARVMDIEAMMAARSVPQQDPP